MDNSAQTRRRRPRQESSANGDLEGSSSSLQPEKTNRKTKSSSASSDRWALPEFYRDAKSRFHQQQSVVSAWFVGHRGWKTQTFIVVAFLMLLVVLCAIAKISTNAHSRAAHLPILLPYLRYKGPSSNSIGGWLVPRNYPSRFLLQQPLKDILTKNQGENNYTDPWRDEEDEESVKKTSEESEKESSKDSETEKEFEPPQARDENGLLPDYGGLLFTSLNPAPNNLPFRRTIRKNDAELYNVERQKEIESMNNFYISKRHWRDDELEDIEMECRRPNWETVHYPNCNAFHEVDLSRSYDTVLAKRIGDIQEGNSRYLSHGYFRDVLLLDRPYHNESGVLKVARYTKHDINFRSVLNAQRDALIMERLSGSPRIVDIYGHCAASVMVESLPKEVEKYVVPGSGYAQQEDLNDSVDVDIKNEFTVPEKLHIALQMAESIADLHGFKDGVIVHDDIQLCQWLRNRDGKIKLGDFNRARVLQWDEKHQEYCKYNNGKGYGNYRSPEEYSERDLNEKLDVYSFGNNLYGLLTGLWVFYENEDDEVVQKKVINGTQAFVDKRFRTRSYIEGRMVELMERCWTYDPEKRPSIFDAVKYLKETVKEYERREAGKNRKRRGKAP